MVHSPFVEDDSNLNNKQCVHFTWEMHIRNAYTMCLSSCQSVNCVSIFWEPYHFLVCIRKSSKINLKDKFLTAGFLTKSDNL